MRIESLQVELEGLIGLADPYKLEVGLPIRRSRLEDASVTLRLPESLGFRNEWEHLFDVVARVLNDLRELVRVELEPLIPFASADSL